MADDSALKAQNFLDAFFDFMEGFMPNPVVSIDREKNEIRAHHDYRGKGPESAKIIRLDAQTLWDAYPASVEAASRFPDTFDAADERTRVFMLLQEAIDDALGSRRTPLGVLVQVPGKPVFTALLPEPSGE